MALSMVLNYGLKVIAEAGYYKSVPTRELAETGNPSDATSHKGIWRDEATQTIMLRPLQLDSSWLGTAAQVGSIIRLSQLVVNAADTTAQAIFEAPAFGNADDPFIYHIPVGPAAAFTPPITALAGIASHIAGAGFAAVVDAFTQAPTITYTPDETMPSVPPSATVLGGPNDGKFLCESAARLAANQGLFLRWCHIPSNNVAPHVLEIYIGQFKLRIKEVTVEVFVDSSPHGDRSAFNKVQVCPLFSAGSGPGDGTGGQLAFAPPNAQRAHDRSLLWLPYRRNQVLLYASSGKWALLSVNATPKRLSDNSDWDIVRSDTVVVWVMSPAPGRFQLQTLTYPSGTIKQQFEPVKLDYTPGAAPTVTLTSDTDHGTTLSAARTNPPSYTPQNNAPDDCPKPTTTATDQSQTYGLELSLHASSDQKWTPFFYALNLARPRTFGANPATPVTIADSQSGGSHIASLELTIGRGPGEGRCVVETLDVWNGSAFPLAVISGKSGYPVQLTYGGNNIFTGIAEPSEVVPLKLVGNAPRRIVFPCLDLWKLLAASGMRDLRDWTGAGHIDAVVAACAQGGIDASGGEFPAGYTAGTVNSINTALGAASLPQQTKDLQAGWAPRDDDTAASFIQRIAELYSGWVCGFRANGTFFYLPRTNFMTPTTTFSISRTGAAPQVYGDPTFSTEEPEANTILVKCADAKTGTVRYSGLWVDWASVLNPAAPNYIGREKREVIVVGGTFDCSQLNWIARTIWRWTRRRIFKVRFEADWVPGLEIGHVFAFSSGATFQGNYWVTSVSMHVQPGGLYRATYTGELVESGSSNTTI